MKKNRLVVLLTFIIMVSINALANIVPFNQITTGEVSDYYGNLFAPAPITFAIWGLIYALLLIYTLYQLFVKDEINQLLFDKIGYFFSLSSVLNAAWIICWHYDFMLATLVLMIAILICLIMIRRLIAKSNLEGLGKWLTQIPFSVYFGWITIATIANVTTYLVSIGWEGLGLSDTLWTVIILMVGLLIVTVTMLRFKDIVYGLVGVWAYTGILIKHVSAEGFSGEYPLVIMTASIAITLLLVVGVRMFLKGKGLESQ